MVIRFLWKSNQNLGVQQEETMVLKSSMETGNASDRKPLAWQKASWSKIQLGTPYISAGSTVWAQREASFRRL